MTDFAIILCTCPDHDEAERIARRLVELRLAACVNLIPAVQSIYRWQGNIESAAEVLMMIKTTSALTAEVQSTISTLHSYEIPEFLVVPITSGSPAYLGWLAGSLA